jgi:hypothetical protein
MSNDIPTGSLSQSSVAQTGKARTDHERIEKPELKYQLEIAKYDQ